MVQLATPGSMGAAAGPSATGRKATCSQNFLLFESAVKANACVCNVWLAGSYHTRSIDPGAPVTPSCAEMNCPWMAANWLPDATEIFGSPSAMAKKLLAGDTMLNPSALSSPDAGNVVTTPVVLTVTPDL